MRRSSRESFPSRLVPIDEFGWEISLALTLRHSTLPWTSDLTSIPLEGIPIADASRFGERDRLSILGQYAAHQAFLRFAGVFDCAFDADQWIVLRKRGSDCRLVRVRAEVQPFDEDLSPLERIEECAASLGVANVEPLQRAWGRPESVYRAIGQRLHTTAADTTWFCRSAIGSAVAPDAETLRTLSIGGRTVIYDDASVIDVLVKASSIANLFDVTILGGGSLLRKDSALEGLKTRIGSTEPLNESEIAERVIESAGTRRHVFVLRDPAMLDDRSRSVIRLLSGLTDDASWFVPAEGTDVLAASRIPVPLPKSRRFILSERLVALAELDRLIDSIGVAERDSWLEEFVSGDDYRAFLDRGDVPEAPVSSLIRHVTEPRRSYLAALSLLGETMPDASAVRFLKQLGCRLDLDDLIVEGLTTPGEHRFAFVSRDIQQCFLRTIPDDSRASLSKLAAEIIEEDGDPFQCAALYENAGDRSRAVAILETFVASNILPASELFRRVAAIPRAVIAESATLQRARAGVLVACGRYEEARAAAASLSGDDRNLILARVERRVGNYASAEAHLFSIAVRSFEAELLLAESLRLQGKLEEAASRFENLLPLCRTELDRLRAGYERALVALDLEELPDEKWISDTTPEASYYSCRFRAYVAVDRGEHETAIAEASRARDLAPTLPDRIDAELDLLYAKFLTGRWEEARHDARRALVSIEETEGDRAAGGVLFTLAFLCADAGQWLAASRGIDRLRRFYAARGDARRKRELDLIAAQSSLTRCEFQPAKQLASSLLAERMPPEMREAAALIVDECNWILDESDALQSTGRSLCRELQQRHLLMALRLGDTPTFAGGFHHSLAQWESSLRARKHAPIPPAHTRSEKLQLLRALLGHAKRSRGFRDEIARLAAECGVELAAARAKDDGSPKELEILRLAAIAEFPFGERDLGDLRWRYATRNRLGNFSEIGSLPPLAPRELANAPHEDGDWTACGDSGWLYVEGLSRWSTHSRDALASLFRVRAEHFNLKRVAEQDEMIVADAAPKQIDGILGSSPAIVELLGLVVRLARSDVPICILGESGTGKELIARAIHKHSARRSRPFTAINCAALPENLIESELFGHVRGAFTGADRDRAGLIETSDGGTLFLDEIGELPLLAQAKLLRFLQEGEFRRVGDTVTRTADVRIVAATNRKLESAVDEGRFREDLYYRIRGVEVNVPPLRERGSDIVVLARHFLAKEREKQRIGPDRFLTEVESVFLAYRWPGNVRELQNAVRAAYAIAGDSRQVRLDHLPERLRGVVVTRTKSGSLYDELNQFRKKLIERSLAESRGNQSQAAKRLGISRQALAYQIRELGILVS